MEWADRLIEWKCGEPKPGFEDVEPVIGDRYRIYWLGDYECDMTVTEENMVWFRHVLNPWKYDCDTWSAEAIK